MANEPLNYECKLFIKGKCIADFKFHANTKEMAEAHVNYCFKTHNSEVGIWRKIGNINWRTINQ